MDYVTESELKQAIQLSGESFADGQITDAITAASRSVDAACGRRFWKDETAQTRLYYPTRRRWVEIDDLVELTSISYDLTGSGTFTDLAAADYIAAPANAENDGWPWTSLKLAPNTAIDFYAGETAVRIVGKFGWPQIPSEIKEATLILASRLIKRVREAPFGVAGIGADGIAVRVSSSDPDVKMLLAPYTRTLRLA